MSITGPESVPAWSDDMPPIGDSWLPRSLLDYEADPPPPPSIGQALYAGKRHIISGEPESGKSWLALAWCAEVLKSGRPCAYVDHEMGPAMTLERLRILGVSNAELVDFRYTEPTEHAIISARQILELAEDAILVVIDSTIGSLALHDLDPNSGRDIEKWYQNVVDQLRGGGAAVVALDHVPKDPNNRGKFAIGSERKVGAVDVHLGVETITPFGRTRTGRAKVTVRKDRPGHLQRPTLGTFTLEPASGYTWELFNDEQVHDDAGHFRPTVLMQRVSEYVERYGPCSKNQIETNVEGRSKYLRQAIDALEREHFIAIQGAIGVRGGGQLVTLLRPFHAEDSATPNRTRDDVDRSSSNLVPSSSGTNLNEPRPPSRKGGTSVQRDELKSPNLVPLKTPCPICRSNYSPNPYSANGGTYCCEPCAQGDTCNCKYLTVPSLDDRAGS